MRLESILARLHARRDSERVFVKLYPDAARAEADAADSRKAKGESLGPLDGKIVSIKDLLDVAGEPTLAGSIIRRSAPAATEDAVVLERLRAAGAAIIGKTHMTEFAFTAVGLNPHYPVLGNAVNDCLIPGGSSSGAAVSVAEGTCDIAIGSDTGGSIRIPAALNGLVGFKPTARRVPLTGAFPLSYSYDSLGPLARTVADCVFTDAIIAGEAPEPVAPMPLAGLKIGIPRGRLLTELAPEVAVAFETRLRQVSKAGAELGDCLIDDLLDRLAEATSTGSISSIEASRIHADWLVDEAAPVDIRVASTLRRRMKVSQSALDDLLRTRQELIMDMDRRMLSFDFLILPTTVIPAVSIASVSNDENEYERVEDLLLRNTQVANQFDLTAITLPMPDLILPAGIMLMGRNGTDKQLLGAAAAVESLLAKR